jgi:small GTP-binding protein
MNLNKSQNLDTKVIMVGDSSVGKTSILTQFSQNIFSDLVETTVGAMFRAKQISTTHGLVNLLMWDTAGQERYRSLIPMYSRNASAAILVIDVTNQNSVASLDHWYSMLKENCPPTTKVYVVANKMDLPVECELEAAERFAIERNCPFFRTSALRYESVEPVFLRIAEDFAPGMEPVAQVQKQKLPTSYEHDDDGCC